MTEPWIQTSSGKAVDLLTPEPDSIDFRGDVAEALARIPRFNGHVRAGPYSVAQHCVLGADWLWRKRKRSDLAAWFVLHDAHEYLVGDIATPVVAVLDLMHPGTKNAVAILKGRIDVSIHRAAGIEQPGPADAKILHTTDIALMNAERRWLHTPPPKPWGAHIDAVPPLPIPPDQFRPWPWATAADRWLHAFERYRSMLSPFHRRA